MFDRVIGIAINNLTKKIETGGEYLEEVVKIIESGGHADVFIVQKSPYLISYDTVNYLFTSPYATRTYNASKAFVELVAQVRKPKVEEKQENKNKNKKQKEINNEVVSDTQEILPGNTSEL